MCSIFLVSDRYGRAQATVGTTTFGQVGLGGIRKQAEQVIESKPVSKVPPRLLLQLLPAGSALSSYRDFPEWRVLLYTELNPPLPRLLLGHCLSQQQKANQGTS